MTHCNSPSPKDHADWGKQLSSNPPSQSKQLCLDSRSITHMPQIKKHIRRIENDKLMFITLMDCSLYMYSWLSNTSFYLSKKKSTSQWNFHLLNQLPIWFFLKSLPIKCFCIVSSIWSLVFVPSIIGYKNKFKLLRFCAYVQYVWRQSQRWKVTHTIFFPING